MRHPYTPIFRDLLDSSLWASATPNTRCVWITFLLDADPEGHVATSIPGLARRANVTVQAARAAIDMLEAPDPDSRTPDFKGRRIAKVPGGWKVLNFVAKRELAKHEAEKARKRKWANANGKRPPVANDNDEPSRLGLDATSETLDAPKPKPKPKPSSSEGGSPLPPAGVFDAPTVPAVLRQLSEWRPTEAELAELRDEARIQGVKHFDQHLARLATGPIGGSRGVLPDKVGDYVRSQFPKWRLWEEQDRAKANSANATGSPRRFGNDPAPTHQPQRERVQGAPEWVYVEHATFARNAALDLARAAKAFHRQARVKPSAMKPADVFDPFMKYLENLAAARAEEASA